MVPSLGFDTPHMQENHSFVDNISGVVHNFLFNCQLIPNVPQCPGLHKKQHHEQSTTITRQAGKNVIKLGKIRRVQAAPQ
jgi:hypothetical protein